MHAQYRRCNKLERFSVAKRYPVLISRISACLVGAIALIAFANVCAYVYLRPALPDVDSLRDVQRHLQLDLPKTAHIGQGGPQVDISTDVGEDSQGYNAH